MPSLKVRLNWNDFFQANVSSNEGIQFYYYETCFCSFFWGNWRHQKDLSKLTDLLEEQRSCLNWKCCLNQTSFSLFFQIGKSKILLTSRILLTYIEKLLYSINTDIAFGWVRKGPKIYWRNKWMAILWASLRLSYKASNWNEWARVYNCNLETIMPKLRQPASTHKC